MPAWKSLLVVSVVLGCPAGSALAQQGNANVRVSAPFPAAGTNADVLSINQGFGAYGLPGSTPDYQGYGLVGFGPAASLNDHGAPWVGPAAPATSAKPKPLAGPMPTRARPAARNRPALKSGTAANLPGKQS